MRRLYSGTAAVALFLALGSVGLFAQAARVNFTVPHSFLADGKEYGPGSYQVSATGTTAAQLMLRNVKTNESVALRFITRLSQSEDKQPSVAFDVAGDTYYLAEVHFLGVDGFHLQGAPGPHTHAVFKASK